MPLIINSNGKVELISPLERVAKGLIDVFKNCQLDVATDKALESIAGAYGIHRQGNISDAEFRDQIFNTVIK